MTIPLTWVEAPDRAPRPNTSLDVLPIHDVPNDHFVGFTYVADPCAFPNPLPKDCYIQIGATAGTAKTFGGVGNEVVTQVFGAYQGIECTLGGDEEFREIAQRVLENGEYRVLDGALVATLSTSAAATTPATATTITSAIGVLEQYLAGQVPGQGYIYLTPLAATFAVANSLLVLGIGGELTTYLGTPVVVLTEPSMLNVAYASGPVNIWRGEIVVNDAQNVTVNHARAIAERLYTLNIECGAWKIAFTPPAADPASGPTTSLELTIGTEPASPIPEGTDTTITVHATTSPTDEVHLWYRINGAGWVDDGEMAETSPLEFVENVDGALTNAGDVVELYAAAGSVMSPTITVNVT